MSGPIWAVGSIPPQTKTMPRSWWPNLTLWSYHSHNDSFGSELYSKHAWLIRNRGMIKIITSAEYELTLNLNIAIYQCTLPKNLFIHKWFKTNGVLGMKHHPYALVSAMILNFGYLTLTCGMRRLPVCWFSR